MLYQAETTQTIAKVSEDNTAAGLAEALREAEEKLLVSRQIEQTLKLQHQQEIQEVKSKV